MTFGWAPGAVPHQQQQQQRRKLLIIDLSKYRLLVDYLQNLLTLGFRRYSAMVSHRLVTVVHRGDNNSKGVSYLKRMVRSVAYQDTYQNLSLSENSGYPFSSAFGDVPPPPPPGFTQPPNQSRREHIIWRYPLIPTSAPVNSVLLFSF